MKAVIIACVALLACLAAATELPCTEVRYMWKDCLNKIIRRVDECYCLVLTDDESDGCGEIDPCGGSENHVSGNLTFYYTRYDVSASDPFNVKSVDVTFGPTSFSISNKMKVAKVAGADGITGNPGNDHEVFVGGHESGKLIRVDVVTGNIVNYQSDSSLFHLEVSNPTTIFSGVSEDPHDATFPQIFKINAAGVVVSHQRMEFTSDSDDERLTQVITTPYGYFYTAGNFWEAANFGRLQQVGSKWKAEVLASRVNAAHGASYDPWTNSIIMGGTQQLAQFRMSSYTWSYLNVASLVTQLDQLIVDGYGHVWAADNGGKLLYVNYRDSKDISAPTYRTSVFLDSNLDDIAPLIGHGGVCETARATGAIPNSP